MLLEKIIFLATSQPTAVAVCAGLIITIFLFYKRQNPEASERAQEQPTARGRDLSLYEDENSPLRKDEVEEEDYDAPSFDEEVNHIPFKIPKLSESGAIEASWKFYQAMNKRRTCRFFSSEDVPREIIENIIRTGGTSPSGAHTEPWSYVVIRSPQLKRRVREVVEEEEYLNYTRRMGERWVKDLAFCRTSWEKPYLEHVPWLVAVFRQTHGQRADGKRKTHYYSEVSVSVSIGLVLAAVTTAGLVTVTHTPLNAGPQLRELLSRPSNEKLAMLLPFGYPAADATVPDLRRKPLAQIMTVLE